MTPERAFTIAKDYLQEKLGLEGKNCRFKDGDRTFQCTVILEAEERHFEVFMAAYGNMIRLTEHLFEETFYSFVKPETGIGHQRRLESQKQATK